MHYHKEKNHLVIEIDERIQGMTLLEFFHYLHLSKKTIHLLRQNKDYTLNNTYVDYQIILKDKDILSIKAYETGRDFIEQESSLEIIYEDDLLCIVNKPSNLIIHPDDKSKKDTLCNYVIYYYKQSYQDLPIRYLHRLDRDTTGLVMFCKCALLQPFFDALIASKEIKKTYLAIIQGHLPKREMTIDLPIGQDRHSKNKMCISKTGKDALTHFKEIKTKGNYTLVKCQIETGRKHQIRVHLNHLHHPIIGDTLYGKTSSMIKRMALHAYCLEFIHPLTYQTIKIECLLPFDMEKIFR